MWPKPGKFLAGALVFSLAAGVWGEITNPPTLPPVAGDNWADHNGGYDGMAYSTLDDITPGNAGRLGLAWSLNLPDEKRGLEATPLAVDGMLYFTGSLSNVYAVDGISGKIIWTYDPGVWQQGSEHMPYIFGVNRGAAYANGKIFVGTLDGRLIALDAKSGKPVWSADTSDGNSLVTITGAPLVFGDKVMIGQGGGDIGVRGYVTAYNIDTGKQAWRFYVVPGSPEENTGDPVMEMAARTWDGEYWKSGTGGGPWHGMTYDRELNRVYIGTSNGGPWDVKVRSPGNGDNLFLASIVALDADTGEYVWHYQVNPRESWDFKATANMTVATLEINGEARKVLLQAPTNGFFYVLDRETGKVISAEKFGKATWAERIDLESGRPVEVPGLRFENGPIAFWPSPWGVHNWHTMSYSPQTKLAYIPVMQVGARYDRIPGSGGALSLELGLEGEDEGTGGLLAWDPVKQNPVWKVKHDTVLNGGTAVTAGGVVFQGTGGGEFAAYDASNGKRLWHIDAGLGIVAAPITYRAKGEQYVSILVGYGGGVEARFGNDRGWKYGLQPRRLLTFKLDGKAEFVPAPPPDYTVKPLDNPDLEIDRAQADAGLGPYLANCAICHGGGLKASGGNAPDLRESAISLDLQAFKSVVQQGSLLRRGMPRFNNLSDDDVRNIFMHVRAGARKLASDPSVDNAADAPAALH